MNDLLNLQDKFQQYLLQDQADFHEFIVSTEKVNAEIRLSIYSNAYRSRLVEALASNFPTLNNYLGDEFFEKIAIDYIDQHPSSYRSIRWFGNQLPEFLNDHHEYKAFPYLTELARFEWVQTLVFDGPDSPVLQIEEVAQIPPEAWTTMQLIPHPTLHRINLSWNVVQLWQSISDEQNPPDPVKNLSPIPWIVWRRDFINRFCSLEEAECWAIDAVLDKRTFGEIGEGLCQWFDEDDAGLQAASLLKNWIQSGLITQINLNQ